jgi:hypothetical protein
MYPHELAERFAISIPGAADKIMRVLWFDLFALHAVTPSLRPR